MLLVKVSLLGTTQAVTLTVDDVEHLTSAIRVFSTHVRDKIPPSKTVMGFWKAVKDCATTLSQPLLLHKNRQMAKNYQ